MSKVLQVFKTTDESRNYASTSGVLTADSELELALEAGKTYWIEAQIVSYAPSTYATQINVDLYLDGGTLDVDPQHFVCLDSMWHSSLTGFQSNVYRGRLYWGDGVTYEPYIDNSLGDNSNFRGGMRFRGILSSSTAATLRIRWAKQYNGLGPDAGVTVYAGSYMIAYEMNPCA